MTKYIIYPCTDSEWLRVFKKISQVAKRTGMYIKEINIVPIIHKNTQFLKEDEISYDIVSTPKRIYTTVIGRWKRVGSTVWYKEFAYDCNTIIILEKK